jgi:hypothetical protein
LPGLDQRPISAPVTASKRNRRETTVVDWLIDRLAIRLADRAAERHPPPWEPRQNVLLGVLEPTRVQPPSKLHDEVAKEQQIEEATQVETVIKPTGEVPSLGLDFRVTTEKLGAVELTVSVAFALYLEEIAKLEEQRTYLGSTALENENGPQPGAHQPTITSAEMSPAAGLRPEEPVGAGAALPSARKQQAKKTRLLGAWRRHNVNVDRIQVVVPMDGEVVCVSEPLASRLARSLRLITPVKRPCALLSPNATRSRVKRWGTSRPSAPRSAERSTASGHRRFQTSS